MRSFGQFYRKCAGLFVLMLVLTCSAQAGDVQYPGVTETQSVTTNGLIQYPGTTVNPVIEIALSLLQGTLSLI